MNLGYYLKRTASFIIDSTLFLALVGIVVSHIAFDNEGAALFVYSVGYVLFICYQILTMKLNNGRGIGGRILGLRVKSLSGSEITWFQSIVRSFVLIFVCHIGWISILFQPFSKKRQAFWDYFSKTHVVEFR